MARKPQQDPTDAWLLGLMTDQEKVRLDMMTEEDHLENARNVIAHLDAADRLRREQQIAIYKKHGLDKDAARAELKAIEDANNAVPIEVYVEMNRRRENGNLN